MIGRALIMKQAMAVGLTCSVVAPQGEDSEVQRLREALRKVKQAARYVAVGDGYFDRYANHIEAVDAIVDAALAPAAIASGREGAE